MYECVRLYENAYINACEIETLAMVEGHKPLFFFLKKKFKIGTLAMPRGSRITFFLENNVRSRP